MALNVAIRLRARKLTEYCSSWVAGQIDQHQQRLLS